MNYLFEGPLSPCLFRFVADINFIKIFYLPIIMLLYKRAFRKEKEVVTFFTNPSKRNFAINLQLLSQMRRLKVQYSPRATGKVSLAPCPQSTGATYTQLVEGRGSH